MKAPYRMTPSPISSVFVNSGLPTKMPMIGLTMSATKLSMTCYVNTPKTNATAIKIRFPLKMNATNSFHIFFM